MHNQVTTIACVVMFVFSAFGSYALAAGSNRTQATQPAAVKGPRWLASLTVEPSDGATDVGLDTAIRVTAARGSLGQVTVTTAGGAVIPGTLTPSGSTWESVANLAPSTSYRVTAVGVGPGGANQVVTHFTTLTPRATLGITTTPDPGSRVGVGEPIVLTDRKSVV